MEIVDRIGNRKEEARSIEDMGACNTAALYLGFNIVTFPLYQRTKHNMKYTLILIYHIYNVPPAK